MDDADELARRYLGLWAQYLAALLADPRAIEMLKRWMALADRFAYPASGTTTDAGGASLPAWPPVFGPFGPPPVTPGVAAASAARDEETATLARRIDELERRVAALEQARPRSRPSRRGGRSGAA